MFGKLLKKAVGAVNTLGKVPIVGTALKAVPGVGAVMAGASLAGTAYNVLSSGGGGGGGGGLPPPPSMAMSSMPALPGTANAPSIVGDRSIFRNDPNIAEALKAWAISARNLRTAYRSPVKGYVVVRDGNGDPYALPKKLARMYAGWKPSKKPPISVGEWESLKRAHRTVKKVKKITSKMTQVEKQVTKGGKVKARK